METHFEASQQTNFQLLMQMFNPTGLVSPLWPSDQALLPPGGGLTPTWALHVDVAEDLVSSPQRLGPASLLSLHVGP